MILLVCLAGCFSVADELDSIFLKVKSFYSLPRSIEDISFLIQRQNLNGTWNEIGYFKGQTPIEHLKNVRRLAEFYEYSCPDVLNEALCEKAKNSLELAMGYWFSEKENFISDNWWMNEIGIQRELAPISFLAWDVFSDNLKKQILNYFPEKPSRNGANRTWISENVLIRGILEHREDLIKLGVKNIEFTMRRTEQEGIQQDDSFFMHGNQLYNGGYGKIALAIAVKWAFLMKDTHYAFSDKCIQNMVKLALEGLRWMSWKGMVDPMTLGREISRKGGNRNANTLLPTIQRLKFLDSSHIRQFELWENDITSHEADSLNGCRYFWKGEFLVCRSRNFYVSVKMSSKRTVGSESINRENRCGFWLGAGVMSVYRHAEDYENIYPIWDWSMLPGTTSDDRFKQEEKRVSNQSEFVGGIGDSVYGIATMDLNWTGVQGKKSWFFIENRMIALGSGINGTMGKNVTTTIDQRFTDVEQMVKIEKNFRLDSLYFRKVFWLDSIGYRSLDEKEFSFVAQNRTGNWGNIGTLKEKMSGTILTIFYDHGKIPRNSTYAYLVNVNVGEKEFLKGNDKEIWIVENSEFAQVLCYPAKFYLAGSLYSKKEISAGSLKIQFSNSCLFMLTWQKGKLKLLVSDPSQKLDKIYVQMSIKKKGRWNKVLSQEINFPQKELLGKSIVVPLQL